MFAVFCDVYCVLVWFGLICCDVVGAGVFVCVLCLCAGLC